MAERILLVFLIDALGHRVVRETGSFAFLQGGETPVPSVCGYSSACIPSLLTGAWPREHGHWAMYLSDPARSVFRPYRGLIRVVGGWLGRPYLTRRLLARLVRRRGIDGYFSLYEIPAELFTRLDLCEKRCVFSPGAFPGRETLFDACERLRVPYRVWHWNVSEAERRSQFEAALRGGRERVLFCYSPELDAVMHAAGTRGEPARACLADLEAWIVSMLALADEQGKEARVLICGDHGMADVTAVHSILPELEALGLRMPEEVLYFVDSTMVRVWYRQPAARARVEALLEAKPYGRLLEDEERRRLGIDFPDGRYGETIFLMNAGEILVPSFMGRSAPRAMHGYHPEDPDSDTVALTNFAHAPVTSIRDIGPLLVREVEALCGEAR